MKKLIVIIATLTIAAAAYAVVINPWEAAYGHKKTEPALVTAAEGLVSLWDASTKLTETEEGRLDTDDADNFRDTYEGKRAWTYILVKLKYPVANAAGFEVHWEAYSDPYKGKPCEIYVWDPVGAKFILVDRGPEGVLFTEARKIGIESKYWAWDSYLEEYVCTLLIEHHNVDGFRDFNVDVVNATF